MNRCYDERRGVWMVNHYDGQGWKPENGEWKSAPVVSAKSKPDLRASEQAILARLYATRRTVQRLFDEQKVNEVFEREQSTAQRNARYLL